MNTLATVLQSDVCQTLLIALMHTLWQALLIAGALWLLLRTRRKNSPRLRYNVAVCAMLAILLSGLITWAVLNHEPAVTRSEPVAASSSSSADSSADHADSVAPRRGSSAVAAATDNADSVPRDAFNWRMLALVLWFTGAALMLCRAAYMVAGTNRLRSKASPLADSHTAALIEQLRRQMRISRRIEVAVSDRISVPGVVGVVWPTLLLPASMLTAIPTEDLGAILAHELAHIKRCDYLVNFLQMVAEAVLFFNPALWWVSRQIRIEREACCDAAAVSTTNQPVTYARVLTAFAARLSDAAVKPPAAALVGFAGPNQSGSLLDRVKRIVVEGHRPRLKVSWHIALIMLFLSVAALIGLWKGTNLTVALAGKLLTPQERIEKVAEITENHGPEDREYGKEDEILLVGSIATWDGRPLLKDTNIMVHSKRPGWSSSSGIGLSKNGPFTYAGPFEYSAEFGEISIMVDADGYAPAMAGPFSAKPGGLLTGINITLEDGFGARIKVTDPNGAPVEAARLVGGYTYDGGSYSHTVKLTTNRDGIARIEKAAAFTLALQVTADGYQTGDTHKFTPDPNAAERIVLTPAEPTSGTVISKATGKPVAGAEIRILMRKIGSHFNNCGSVTNDPSAVTDEQGRFTLTRLRSDSQHLALVQAPLHAPEYLSNVRAGQKDIEVMMEPAKPITGVVKGDLSRLRVRRGKPVISYTNNYSMENSSNVGRSEYVEVDPDDGIAEFKIEDYWGQKITIRAGGERIDLDPETDPLEDIVIHLSPEQDPQKRLVVLKFQPPEGSPPVNGGVRFDYITEEDRQKRRGMRPGWTEIEGSQVQIHVPVPCDFKYSIDFHKGKRPVGYWFDDIRPVDVNVSDEPYVMEVPVYPAGTIHGLILNADGTPARDSSASLITVKRPERVQSRTFYDALYGSGLRKGKINATPLPLGGTYMIVAHKDDSWVASKPIELDARHPIREVQLTIPEGVTLRGRLLDHDGSPARMMVHLRVSVNVDDVSWGSGGTEIRPDADGRFEFQDVNPDLPGDYYIQVTTDPGYRPVRHKVEDISAPVELQLEKGLAVSGTVIDDATGYPVPGVRVWAWASSTDPERSNYESVQCPDTDEDGRFKFSNMARRKYRLHVGRANIVNATEPINVIGGQEEPVTIRIEIPENSDLEPRKPEEN